MSTHKLSLRIARRARLATLALWGALMLAAPAALAEGPAKPRTFAAAECSEASVAGGKVMLCQTAKAKSATVLRRWTVVKDDAASWVVGFTK